MLAEARPRLYYMPTRRETYECVSRGQLESRFLDSFDSLISRTIEREARPTTIVHDRVRPPGALAATPKPAWNVYRAKVALRAGEITRPEFDRIVVGLKREFATTVRTAERDFEDGSISKQTCLERIDAAKRSYKGSRSDARPVAAQHAALPVVVNPMDRGEAVAQKLRALQKLFGEGLITQEEYEARRAVALDGLCASMRVSARGA